MLKKIIVFMAVAVVSVTAFFSLNNEKITVKADSSIGFGYTDYLYPDELEPSYIVSSDIQEYNFSPFLENTTIVFTAPLNTTINNGYTGSYIFKIFDFETSSYLGHMNFAFTAIANNSIRCISTITYFYSTKLAENYSGVTKQDYHYFRTDKDTDPFTFIYTLPINCYFDNFTETNLNSSLKNFSLWHKKFTQINMEEGYQLGLTEGLQAGYDNGYYQGHSTGQASGFNNGKNIGYNEGYSQGETDGYYDGYNIGEGVGQKNTENALTFIPKIFASVGTFIITTLSGVTLFGVTLWQVLLTVAGVSIIIFFLKFLV